MSVAVYQHYHYYHYCCYNMGVQFAHNPYRHTYIMDLQAFKQAEAAATKFIEKHGDDIASLDTILILSYIDVKLSQISVSGSGSSGGSGDGSSSDALSSHDIAPPWLHNTLASFAGRKITASDILNAAGKPGGIRELRQCGAWLRAILGEPSRSNGRIVYAVPAAEKPAGSGESDPEDTAHPSIPLASRVKIWASKNVGSFTVDDIATAMHVARDQTNRSEIWAALTQMNVPWEGGKFTLGRR